MTDDVQKQIVQLYSKTDLRKFLYNFFLDHKSMFYWEETLNSMYKVFMGNAEQVLTVRILDDEGNSRVLDANNQVIQDATAETVSDLLPAIYARFEAAMEGSNTSRVRV
jgi:C4-type Zn-finger protein